ncbi:nucleolar complex protein 4 homolog [Protopterus annectens]|uniref:nucleolar complex protein 4 homolog n=1 Tax=Protopterus annectens TaxID=7888 RepID=UPI001CF9E1A1|nr:nucleolar complex protein 4 homolog [Protopterus annectens]
MAALSGSRVDNSNIRKKSGSVKLLLKKKLELILESRKNANILFDILEYLQSNQEDELLCAIRTCETLFSTLLERRDLYIGQLPKEEEALTAEYSAEEKYKIWMRHRYHDCVKQLLELMVHTSFQVKEATLCTLMKFIQMEGGQPLVKADWDESFFFPHELLKSVVEHLLQIDEDSSLLIARFQEFLEYDDVRYYVMISVNVYVSMIMQKMNEAVLPVFQQNIFSLISSVVLPDKESEMNNFLVKPKGELEEWRAAKLKEHKGAFERMWLGFLKHKLPSSLYKKVLVILHETILPHMRKPVLMIDFLTAAYEVGGAISLLALNGLFVLVHEHNLEYPDFYKKLYSLLEPTVFHVKYRARFFHLTNLFLSSTHLPLYLVAAFVKRLSRLALTAPPQALLMVIPFICNLIRRHPACKVLIHRPSGPEGLSEDPYIMEEEDPAKCRALESSLWELKTLQNHYHPDVATAAMAISQPLSVTEVDISELLDISADEMVAKAMKNRSKVVPLEFQPVRGLFGKKDIMSQYFILE